ncbi:MAG: HAMP domain-containing protein [Candidatus Binatia bacterium]
MEVVFYALIGVCALLLALRVIIFAIRVYRNERPRVRPELPVSSRATWRAENTYEAVPLEPFQPILSAGHDEREAKHSDTRARRRRVWRGLGSTVFYGQGLTGKMVISFSAIIATFGLLAIATVYFTLTSSLKRHASERASVTAVNIRDSVPEFVFKKDISGLRALLRNYASQKGVAYVLVENGAGKILAHSFAVLPEEVKRESLHASVPEDRPRALQVGQRAVHEVAAPVSDGRVGGVRLGIWRDEVNDEVFWTVMPLVKLILFVIGVGILLAIFLAWKINRPIRKLVKAAKSISTGDLTAPSLDVEDPTEFGELSRALERLRSSVNAAMNRLNAER